MKTMNLAILFSGNGSNLENIYKKMQDLVVECESSGNSSLDKHSADSANFEHSQTSSLVSRSKFAESNESHTENTSVVLNADFSESNKTTSDCAEVSCDGFVGCVGKFERDKTWSLSSENFSNSRKYAHETIAHIKLNFPLAISSSESAFGITRCANLGLKCEVIDYKQNKADFIPKIIATLESYNIDLVILAGFMRILPPQFNAKFRAINIHPSILPLFKGAHAIAESFESDMKIAGVSVHFVSDELDSGALIAQDIIQKIDGESFESFEGRIHALEYELYPKAIEKAVQILVSQNPQFLSHLNNGDLGSGDSQRVSKVPQDLAPKDSQGTIR